MFFQPTTSAPVPAPTVADPRLYGSTADPDLLDEAWAAVQHGTGG